RAHQRVDLDQLPAEVARDRHLLRPAKLFFSLEVALRVDRELGDVQADRDLQAGFPRGAAMPGEGLAEGPQGRGPASQLRLGLALGVERVRQTRRVAGRLVALARPRQVFRRGSE